MECYYFCKQCEHYFDIAEAKRYQYVFFAISFLKDCIIFWCQQHKDYMECNSIVLLSWGKFQSFLYASPEEITALVTNIWDQMYRDFQFI